MRATATVRPASWVFAFPILLLTLSSCGRPAPPEANKPGTSQTTEASVTTTEAPPNMVEGEAPPESPEAESASTTTSLQQTSGSVYVIKSGDSLFTVGDQFGLTIEELAEFNGITNLDSITAGQEIQIPE